MQRNDLFVLKLTFIISADLQYFLPSLLNLQLQLQVGLHTGYVNMSSGLQHISHRNVVYNMSVLFHNAMDGLMFWHTNLAWCCFTLKTLHVLTGLGWHPTESSTQPSSTRIIIAS